MSRTDPATDHKHLRSRQYSSNLLKDSCLFLLFQKSSTVYSSSCHKRFHSKHCSPILLNNTCPVFQLHCSMQYSSNYHRHLHSKHCSPILLNNNDHDLLYLQSSQYSSSIHNRFRSMHHSLILLNNM